MLEYIQYATCDGCGLKVESPRTAEMPVTDLPTGWGVMPTSGGPKQLCGDCLSAVNDAAAPAISARAAAVLKD